VEATGGSAVFLRFLKPGEPSGELNIKGAKNPACNANSASAFPDGKRQLIGSIHSMGICGIRMGELRRPALLPRWLAFWDFMSSCAPRYNFDRVGGFH
jgi:hypothetical protein